MGKSANSADGAAPSAQNELDVACGAEIGKLVRSVRATESDADDLFFDAIGAAAHLPDETRCVVAIMTFVAAQVESSVDLNLLRSYLMVAAAEKEHLRSVKEVQDALSRITFNDFYSRVFFMAQADFAIDRRELARTEAAANDLDTIADHRLMESRGWTSRLYLARFGDARALAAIGSRLRHVVDLNVVTSLLADVYWLGTEPARSILEEYRDDPRRVPTVIDNVMGPTLGEEVRAMLSRGKKGSDESI